MKQELYRTAETTQTLENPEAVYLGFILMEPSQRVRSAAGVAALAAQ
jgi:phosphoribosylanthranilate isomerase